jgi:hypothetical protein
VARLPPIGAKTPMSVLSINTPLTIRDELVSVDIHGRLDQRVDVDPEDPYNSVRLRVTGFRVSGNPHVWGDQGGSITIEIDVDADPKSKLRSIKDFPPLYENRYVLPFAMTIDRPDTEQLVLMAKSPAIVSGRITQFPPRGDLYELETPVDFAAPDDPDTTVVTIHKFPVKLGGL